jgi:CBS domain-containing protein
MRVRDVMKREVHTLQEHLSLNEALSVMWVEDVGALPVVTSDHRVVGMITDRDIAMTTYLRGELPAHVPVREVMARDPWTCGPDDTLAKAEEILQLHQIRRLPVVDEDGKLVGIVTLGDLAHVATQGAWAATAGAVTRTLSAITTPRA